MNTKNYNFAIISASSKESIWEGAAINPRHARKQAAALLGKSKIGSGYVTVQENIPEYSHGKWHRHPNDQDKPWPDDID